MSRWVVGWISFFDNELKIALVEAATWQEAVRKADPPVLPEWKDETLEELRQLAFDCDGAFHMVEV